MKRVFSAIVTFFVCIIFIPLCLGMLFGMPLEFVISSWHNFRVDSSTTGTITHSETITGKGSTKGSAVTYAFQHEGESFESSRWRAGLISNSATETNGGDFARTHTKGSEVTVHYDKSNPNFSILELGWPKWSVGFSLAVWGMLFSDRFKRAAPRTNRLLVGYSLSRATTITGFLTIFFFSPTLTGSSFKILLLVFAICAIIACFWMILRTPRKISAANNEMVTSDRQTHLLAAEKDNS